MRLRVHSYKTTMQRANYTNIAPWTCNRHGSTLCSDNYFLFRQARDLPEHAPETISTQVILKFLVPKFRHSLSLARKATQCLTNDYLCICPYHHVSYYLNYMCKLWNLKGSEDNIWRLQHSLRTRLQDCWMFPINATYGWSRLYRSFSRMNYS